LVKRVLGYLTLVLLGGCSMRLFNPQGDIGVQEKDLIVIASVLMFLVVIPVILLTLYFAWRYRASNREATYSPNWSHSTKIEVVVWTIPIVIVLILAGLIWKTTHSLDPYKPIESNAPPVRVEVVAMNWKWLFIYPDYGIATVNRLQIPVDTPVSFKLTADSIMNSFFIPQLGSQVYAMPGMQTQLNLIANHAGVFHGMSAAFSGEGFADMHFQTVATSKQEFDAWVQQAKSSSLKLTRGTYSLLEQDSKDDPVAVYGSVEPALFLGTVNKYMQAPAQSGTPAPASHDMALPPMAMGTAMPPMAMPNANNHHAE
jgi:cytochrome o ubiquinol oxidase subunit 2